MANIARRIAVLEGTIEGMIAELAELKLAANVPPKVSLPPPALPMTIFNTYHQQKPDLKELFVLMDFETGGKFYRLFFASPSYISNCLFVFTQDSARQAIFGCVR